MPSLQNFYHNPHSVSTNDYSVLKCNGINACKSNSIGYNVTESHRIKGNKIKCVTNNEKENYLPQDTLDSGNFELNDIISIQNKLYERNYHHPNHINNNNNNNNNNNKYDSNSIQPKNRVIRLKKFLNSNKNKKLKDDKKEYISVNAETKSKIYADEDNKMESLDTELSPETKEMNKFVDSLLTIPVNNETSVKRKSDTSPSSPAFSKSIGFVGLNSYNSLWGYNNNINNSIIISTNDITMSSSRKLSTHSVINMSMPMVSPPPYSY